MSFFPHIDKNKIDSILKSKDDAALFDIIVQPLHEELYQRKDFEFMNELSDMQQLLLSYDYLRTQVGQGGFIQFLANGYAPLLMNMPEWFKKIGDTEMAQLIDDVLKVYVLNVDYFKEEISVEDFGKLYEELKEFEELDKRYEKYQENTFILLISYISNHLSEVIVID